MEETLNQWVKPTREVRSRAPDRTIYGNRWHDPIGQPECGLEAHTNGLSRTFYYDVTDQCGLN